MIASTQMCVHLYAHKLITLDHFFMLIQLNCDEIKARQILNLSI